MHNCNGATRRSQFLAWITSLALAYIAQVGFLAPPARPQQNSTDLTAKSLEDLMNIQVTSVSRKQQRLTIGETEDFASSGGVIQLTLEDNRVRLFIDSDAGDRVGLKISSKLPALAKIARDAPASGKS
jgi:hypothetical protein